MKTTSSLPNCNDRSLCWTMRFIGIALLVGSVFFLYKDLSLSMIDNALFTVTSLLGILTVAGSWSSTQTPAVSSVKERKTGRRQPALRQVQNRIALSR